MEGAARSKYSDAQHNPLLQFRKFEYEGETEERKQEETLGNEEKSRNQDVATTVKKRMGLIRR